MPKSSSEPDFVAGGGLLHRRLLLGGGLFGVTSTAAAQAPPWMKTLGAGFSTYGVPAKSRDLQRIVALAPGRTTTGASRTPLHMLEGVITPAGLHFERHHNGVPDIDPARHELAIHGLVQRPLAFGLDALLRYPMTTRTLFIECAGNSGGMTAAEPAQANAAMLHGLLSTSEWTGVPLSLLLDEAGVSRAARWVVAEGADAAAMSRSVPLAKCMDDALVALYQNGEPIRPEQGFPMRLLLPGWEGNISVKWLRRLKLADGPGYTKDETSKYSDLRPGGRADLFTFPMGVKSLILKPSGGLTMQGAGLYEISGLAWSGHGRIARVEVSADGGRSWAQALIDTPPQPMAPVRFRLPWRWSGAPATLMSRATDERGNVQPTRAAWMAQYAPGQNYHYHAIQSWAVAAGGAVSNVYA